MHTKPILAFLKQLQASNNKVWMDANRSVYQAARKELLEIAEYLIHGIAAFDPAVAALQPKDVIFRINRDIRFSKDKTLYKTYMGLFVADGGKKSEYAGYYLHLAPDNQSFIAGGMYGPESKTLQKVRQEIDYQGDKLKVILAEPQFKQLFGGLQGEKLQRPPKGYAADHPHLDLLKFKSFTVIHPIQDKQVMHPDFLKDVLTDFKAMQPLNQFLNAALEE